MRSPEHALAFQSAFKGVLYTPKLPINRTSGHYVTNICCGIISTVTIRIIIIITISTDAITITLLSLLLYYYWWGVVGVGLSRPPPGAATPAPERTYYCVTITTSINIILSVLVVVLVLHVNNVSYVCVTYVWFRFGSRHLRLLYMFMSKHVWRLLAFYFSMFLGGVVV
jgi:hypothetical protein